MSKIEIVGDTSEKHEALAGLARDLGFELHASDRNVTLRGHGTTEVMSPEEARSFLRGFDRARYAVEIAKVEEQPVVSLALLPLSSNGSIAAGSSTYIVARPQCLAFRPDRLAVPAHLAPNFAIEDIRVGNRSQLLQAGSIPGDCFAARTENLAELTARAIPDGLLRLEVAQEALESFGCKLTFDTIQTSMDFTLVVTNISDKAQTFRGWAAGRAAGY